MIENLPLINPHIALQAGDMKAPEPIYSPSRGGTMDFQRCPKLYDLKKRWESTDNPNPQIEMGNLLHAMLADHYRGTILGELSNPVLQKVLKEALSIDLLWDGAQVLAVEQEMGPEKCHPDLVLLHSSGQSELGSHTSSFPVRSMAEGGATRAEPGRETARVVPSPEESFLQVIDWKFSETIQPENMARRLAGYETSWQLKHYAWRVQQEFNLPCRRVSIVQMAAKPKPVARMVSYDITQEQLAAWEVSARKTWALMASGYNAENYEGCRKYGEAHLCPMYSGCHVLFGDESKFETLYTRKESV